MKASILSAALVLAASLTAARAQAPADPDTTGRPPDLDLAAAIERALQANPGAREARLRYEAMLERPDQEKALPDPMFSYSYMARDLVTANGPSMNVIELSQDFPFPGTLPLRAGVSAGEAAAAGEAYRTALQEVLYEVRSAYYRLFRIDRALQILAQESDVLDRLARAARGRYAAGLTAQADILKVQVERSRLEDSLLSLRSEREAVAAHLNALLDRPQAEAVGYALASPQPVSDLPDDPELLRLARSRRPEIGEAAHLVDAGKERESLARREYYPGFRIAAQWNQIDEAETPIAPDSGQDAFMITFGVSLPLQRGRRQAALREARSLRSAAESAARGRANTVESEVRAALAAYRSDRDRVVLYETTLLPQGEATLRSSESAYQSGQADLLSVLDSERSLLQLKLAHAEAQGRFGESTAALRRAAAIDVKPADPDMALAGADESEVRP